MACSISVDDGVSATVVLSGIPRLAINFSNVNAGSTILRFLDGGAKKQHRWRRENYTITGEDRVPSGLRDLDYSQELTITVTTGLGVGVYTGYSYGPEENWNLTGGSVGWSLTVEASS